MNLKALVPIFLLGALAFSLTHPVQAHGTVDQQYAPSFAGAGWNWVGLHDPIGQSFTPTLPSVVAVDLGLENTVGIGRTLTVSIRSTSISGPVLASVTFTLPPGGPSFVHVDFGSPAAVTPATTYFLRVFDPAASAGVRWYIINPGGGYPGGNAITSGISEPGGDYFFRTYGTAGPSGVTTDWAITNIWTDPPAPRPGDPVIFHASVNILSTTGGYPQSVQISCLIDGIPCGAGTFTFTGPGPVDSYTTTPWIATPGGHTVIWTVDPAYAYNDPNRSNNSRTYPFVVVGGPPPGGGTTAGEFDFTISASPTTTAVAPGDQTTYSVTLSLASGSATSVSLSVSGLPSGANSAFNPPLGQPAFTSSMTITTQASASSGSYDLTIIASGGGKTHSVTVRLVVSAQADFSITTATPSQTGSQGQSVAYIIQVNPAGSFNSPVILTVSGLPRDAIGAFDPASGTPPVTSTLRVNLGDRSTSGAYTITVTATGGGKAKTLSLVLNVQERPSGIGLENYWQIIVAVAILAVAVGFFLKSRKKQRKRK